jgi:phosphoheptose isomerase
VSANPRALFDTALDDPMALHALAKESPQPVLDAAAAIVDALGRPGDVAFGIRTSGASPNVVAALEVARARGLQTIALTGRDGAVGRAAAIHVNVPSAATARVQEVHRTLLHVICDIVERA